MQRILGTAKWFRIIGTLCAFFGGVMNVFSGFLIPLFPRFTQTEIQDIGLKIALSSLILMAVAATIAEILDGFTAPQLFLQDIVLREKHLFWGGVLSHKFNFVWGTIVNIPRNIDKGQTAEHSNIEIVFKSRDRDQVRIKSARWSDIDNPVFPEKVEDFGELKSIDLYPNNPAHFILVHREVGGTNIYAFSASDHTQFTPDKLQDLTVERFIGETPVQVSIHVRGTFSEKVFNRILDVDKNNNIILRED